MSAPSKPSRSPATGDETDVEGQGQDSSPTIAKHADGYAVKDADADGSNVALLGSKISSDDGSDIGSDAARADQKRLMLTVLASLGWVGASTWAILVNRHIMNDLDFPYPGTVAGLGMMGTCIASWTYGRVFKLLPPRESPLQVRTLLHAVMPIGLCMALAFICGNTAYLYLSVAFIAMLKASAPVFTMLVTFVFKLAQPNTPLVAAVTLMSLGILCSSYGEGHFSVIGVTIMLASIVLEALRLVLMQRTMSGFKLHPIEGLMYLAPVSTLWMMLYCGMFEAGDIWSRGALRVPLQYPVPFLVSMCSGFALNTLAMCVVTLASALTLKVLAIGKDVGLVVVGVVFLGETVSMTQLCGYVVALVGFVWYTRLTYVPPGGSTGAKA